MKKLLTILMVLMACFSMATTAFAMEDGAYSVYAKSNYWNPDTGEIDDGGTANAALGEGMCRSATGEQALVEKIGDEYYVTIRLLLQSNTKEAKFSKHIGVNQYQSASYEIMAENGVEDSVDYRFQVVDPFAPIKAEMYVTPMGRAVLWYIELDESTLSTETGDFVVSVATDVEPVAEEVVEVVVEEVEAEEVAVEEVAVETEEEIEEVEVDLETEAVEVVEELTETEEVADVAEEIAVEAEEVDETAEETMETTAVAEENNTGKMVAAITALVVLCGAFFLRRKIK